MIVLPTNLKEDDYEGSKKWQQNINGDGTYSFQDVTENLVIMLELQCNGMILLMLDLIKDTKLG